MQLNEILACTLTLCGLYAIIIIIQKNTFFEGVVIIMNKLIGNAVVGQSGGPTAAINATLAGVIREAEKNRDAIKTLYGMRNGIEGLLAENLVDLFALFDSEKKLTHLEHTPASALGSCRKKLPDAESDPDFYDRLVAIFKKYDIRYFFYIGGNDSMDTVAKLDTFFENYDYDIRIIGIPKTIDNDLVITDHTPGFGSAAKYIATMTQEILCDCAVYTLRAVTIIEIMGRDAGWLTASSAIGRAVCGREPDLVYLPEVTFDREKFISDVNKALSKHSNVVVAVSEGIRDADGNYIGASSGATDVFGHKYLAGSGKTLELLVKKEIGCKVRSIELNLCQRCASHAASKTDLTESASVGSHAVSTAVSGISGVVMTILRTSDDPYTVKYGMARAEDIANKTKYVPREFINAEGNGVTDECIKYLLPLIKGEVEPEYKDGLPVHMVI